MILLGVVLVIVGLVLSAGIIFDIGVVLLLIGVVLAIFGGFGRSVGGRRHWY